MSYTIPQIPVTASSILGDDFLEIGGGTGGSRKLLASTFVLTTDSRLDALGTVTSVSASGGLTGFGFTGSPITTDGTLTLTGTLVPTAGGTGLTIFATGDLIQASNSTTLSRLAAVAAGNVLLSGGPNTISSWGKVGIGTHVSGLGSNVATALATNTGTAGAFVLFNGALGMPNSGDASNLTELNATQLTSGTVPDARFPATLPAISGANLTALNASNLGSGTVPNARFPATLPAISGANLTALNASNLGSGTVPDARFPATLPAISGVNLTGTASGLTAGTVTTIPNLSGDVTSAGNTTAIASGVIVNDDINASAAIADTKLATISTVGKVLNTATTATSANTANAIVARDSNGDFIARIVNGTSGVFTALSAVNSVRVTGAATVDGPSSALDYIGGQARVWSWGPNSGTVGTFAVRLANSNGITASEPLTVTSTSTTVSGALYSGNGSALLPSLSFSNDQTTGLYRIGSNNIGVTTGGATVLNISTAGMTVAGTLTANTLLAGLPNFAPTANGAIQLASHTTSAGGIGFGTLLSLHQETDQVLVFRNSSTSWGTFIEATNPGTGQSSAFRMTNTGSSGRSVDIGTGGSTHPVTAVRSRWYLYDTTGSTLIATAQGASSTAGDFKIDLTTASTSTTTGALQVAGGVGVAGALHVGGQITGNVTGNVSGTSGSTTGNAANVTGTVAIGNGGTGAITASAALAALGGQPLDATLTALAGGSDFVKFAGPAGTVKTFTLPNVDAELVYQGGNATLSIAAITQLKLAPELGYVTAGSITLDLSKSRNRIALTGNLTVSATANRTNDASSVLELYNSTASSLTLGWSQLASWKTNGVLPTTIPPGQTFQFLFQCWGTAETDVSINYINPAGSGVFNASNYGLVAGNTASQNVTALQAAVTAAVAATRGTVVIPQGQWDFNAAITLGANPNCQLAIRGEGKGVTVLRLSSDTANALFDFNFISSVGDQRFNFATFSDFTIKPSAPNVKRLIRIKNSMGSFHEAPGCEFYRIAFQGDFDNYANISLENDGCWNTVIRNCLFVGRTNAFVGTVNGTGNAIVVNADNAFSVNGLVSECQFAFMSRAFYCGGLDTNGYPDDTAGAVGVRCEGWTLRDCIAVGLQKGVTFLNGDSNQIPWFNVNNFEMETYRIGWSFRIFNVANVNISDCLLINDENDAFLKYHFYLDRVSFSDIYDNQLKNRPHYAFYLTDNCGIVKIHDNVIDRVATTGFFLGNQTSNCQIRNNIFVTAPPTYLDDSGTTNSVDCQGSITWDPGSLIPGQQDNTTLTVSGVKFGATISLGVPYDLNGLTATANVHSPNVVRITLYNSTGGTIDPGSGTWRVRAINPGP